MKTSVLLRQLEKLKNVYGGDAAARKLELLGKLTRRLDKADEVRRLHEFLCFLHACKYGMIRVMNLYNSYAQDKMKFPNNELLTKIMNGAGK